MSNLALSVNGTAYAGWKSIRVHRSVEEISGSYELSVSELWPKQLDPREIRTGDKGAIMVDGKALVTGFVDSVSPYYDAEVHTISVSGRDATADLVDCAAQHGKGEWRNAKLDQIARDLASPYGVSVKMDADIGAPFSTLAIEPGESAFACLERAARQRGVLLLSDGIGGLVLGKAGSAGKVSTALVEGENIKSCSAQNDETQRYQTYIIKGQRAGSDDVNGAAASSLRATAKDVGVKRARTLVIIGEDEADLAGLQKRADWEAAVRAARSLTVNCTVQGWKHGNGLWTPNSLVTFRSPTLRLDRELLIRDVDLVMDDGGQLAHLVLTPKEAYTPEPVKAQKAPRRAGAKKQTDAMDAFSP